MLSAVTGMALAAGFAGNAIADNCKNVDIHVHNEFEHDGVPIQVKIVDFDYWDDTEGVWREETTLGDDLVIDPGGAPYYQTDRDLERVGGESGVVVRVQFKYMTASNGWSENLNAESDPFTCNDGEHVDVFVE